MKKIFLILGLFVLGFSFVQAGTLGPAPFSAGGQFQAGWTNMGAGYFYNNNGGYYSNDSGSIQSRTSEEFGSSLRSSQSQSVMSQVQVSTSGCTGSESTADCHPEWAEALANCVSGTFNSGTSACEPKNAATRKLTQNVSVCSATNMTGPCRPERVNSFGANYVSRKAEQIGKAQGYTVSCSSERVGFGGIGTDTNTNLDYYYNNICTVNGTTGHGAEILAGSTNWSQWSFKDAVQTITPPTLTPPTTTNSGGSSSSGSTQSKIGKELVSNTKEYITNMMNKAKEQLAQLQNDLKQKEMVSSSAPSASSNPKVEITLDNGSKSGTFSVGDSVIYKISMENVDYVDSYYNTIPKDTCVGGSTNGEQKSWVVKTVAPATGIKDTIKDCQKGATYVISVIGTNKSSGQISASSITVYVRADRVTGR